MGRELRRVPITNTLENHPRKSMNWRGETPLQPMFDETYDQAINEWITEYEQWKERTYHVEHSYCVEDDATDEDIAAFYSGTTYWNYAGGPPDPEYYRPPHPEGIELGIQLRENTSEGTPQTEVYPDTHDGLLALCDEAAVKATVFGYEKISAAEWLTYLSASVPMYRDPSMPGVAFL